MRCKSCQYNQHIYFSFACAINLGQTVIITGGVGAMTTVIEYSETGFKKELPRLKQGRAYHGCSYYENDNKIKVKYNT